MLSGGTAFCIERDEDGAGACTVTRSNSSLDRRFGRKYDDSQSGGHVSVAGSELRLSLEPDVSELRWRCSANMARIAARFFCPSSSDCTSDTALTSAGSSKPRRLHPDKRRLMINASNHMDGSFPCCAATSGIICRSFIRYVERINSTRANRVIFPTVRWNVPSADREKLSNRDRMSESQSSQ
jgi:hypothetical protein